MPIDLTNAQIRFLRGMAHDLRPLMQLGNKGLTAAFATELDAALEHHELVKVKVGADDRETRDAVIADLVEKTDSVLVQRIGHTAVLFRPARDKRHIVLPRA